MSKNKSKASKKQEEIDSEEGFLDEDDFQGMDGRYGEEDDDDLLSEEESDGPKNELGNITNWGRKKGAFYD
jgi:hypothetical protein